MGISYESVGDAELRVGASEEGVALAANRDGLRSLLRLIENLLAAPSPDHIHLTPEMQLTADSQPLVVSSIEPAATAASSTISQRWMDETNVRTLFEALSSWLDYTFDEADWTAITQGLKATDVEQDVWYTYSLIAASRADIEVARDVGAALVHARVTLDAVAWSELHVKVETLLQLLHNYTIANTRP